MPPSRLAALYSAADVLVLPSRQDTWALPVPEALAAGCVVVASEYAGSSALVEHGVSGFLLEGAGRPEELAALLDGPLADPAVRAAVASRGPSLVAPLAYEAVYRRYRAAHHRAFALRKERLRSNPQVGSACLAAGGAARG
jgi:D-inositol-3-phosphate glycosyltransferase